MYQNSSRPLAALLLLLALPLAGCAADNLFADETISPYGGSKQHPIKVVNGKAVVEDCGVWPENLGDTTSNDLNANHGCAVQANIAAMAAYPNDLTKGRKLPKPLGDIQYGAIKRITGDAADSSAAAAPAAAAPTP